MGGSSEARRLSDVSLPWAGEGFSAGGAEASAGTVIPKQSLFLRSIIRFSDDPGLIRLLKVDQLLAQSHVIGRGRGFCSTANMHAQTPSEQQHHRNGNGYGKE